MAAGSEWVSVVSQAGGGGGNRWRTVGCSVVAACSGGPRSPAWESPSYAVRPRRALGTAGGTLCTRGGRGTQKPVSRGPGGGLCSGKGGASADHRRRGEGAGDRTEPGWGVGYHATGGAWLLAGGRSPALPAPTVFATLLPTHSRALLRHPRPTECVRRPPWEGCSSHY